VNRKAQLRDEIQSALIDRAHPIFEEVGIRRLGHDQYWTREYREQRIGKILRLAEIILLPTARKELKKIIIPPKRKMISGPKRDRGERIYAWARTAFPRGPILYSFWKGKNCIYVGVGESYRRIGHYKKSKYMDKSEAGSLKISSVAGRSYLHSVECLANHLYWPKDNIAKPRKTRYSKSCIVCNKLKNIEDTLRLLLS
jgi:hypothetical protein